MFLILLTGLLFSNLMMIYAYGNFISYRNASLTGVSSISYPVGNVDYTRGQSDDGTYPLVMSADEIEEVDLSEYGVVSYSVAFAENDPDRAMENYYISKNGAAIVSFAKGEYLSVGAERYDSPKVTAYKGNMSFSSTSVKEAILPCTAATMALEYDEATASYGTCIINGTEFRIIGISTETTVIYIPYGVFKSEFKPMDVIYYTENLLSHKKSDALRDRIDEIFCEYGDYGANYVDPYSVYDSVESSYGIVVFGVFLLYSVSLISLAFYMQYFVKRGYRSNAIALLCGASKGRLSLDILIQNISLAFVTFAAAFTVNVLLPESVNLVPVSQLLPKDIIYMIMTVAGATTLMSLPALYMVLNMSAKDAFGKVA